MKIKGKIDLGISITCVLEEGIGAIIKGITRGWEGVALAFIEDLAKLANKEGFELIELYTIPPFDAEILWKIKEKIRRIISPFNDVSYHLPWGEINIAAINPRVRQASISEIKSLIDLVAELNVKKLVMHPGSYTAMPQVYQRMERRIKSLTEKSISEIFNYAKEREISLALENLEPINGISFFCKPEEFMPFVKRGMGIVLDTAHAMRSGVNSREFIKKFGDQIVEVHLADGKKINFLHYFPLGTGEVNWQEVLDELIDIDWQGRIILEDVGRKNLIESLKCLKRAGYL